MDYVARGLKATIHNENTSTAAKESAAQRLQEMGAEVPQDFKGSKKDAKQSASTTSRGAQAQLTRDDDADYESESPDERVTENEGLSLGETNRVVGGYKATLKSELPLNTVTFLSLISFRQILMSPKARRSMPRMFSAKLTLK